ncbi:C4-dicarboxylate ABC transporter [Skermanella stibiiresistens SB22]|uniref:C4-dicarboxylate ABC transporter n=1 Tax=Skermanella stibiiresistens SB22 TaxID=1385369 RepID=W9H1R9_9PROT|nr:C4-dicarboxylate TRAP transporter substrate-binding protein [Skermanella stibiiresistens]EWY38642.1 C4-dicarboxylate ABC transporter [Skermanella stibiiresistens SB22]
MKSFKFLAVLGLAAFLTVPATAQEYRLKFATSQSNPKEPIVRAMKLYADRVKERSDGRVSISILTGDQLGPQKKVNEMVLSGARILNATDYGQLSQFVADMGIVAGPYIYPDLKASDRLFSSDVYAELSKKLEDQGIKILMPNGLFGYRHVLANKPVRTPADLQGVTIRVPPAPIMLETFAAFGARPTELPWSDVYNALQTGVVDAAEAPFGAIASSKLQETRKVISKTNHQIMFTAWVTSTAFFNSLEPDLQAILMEEGKKVAADLTAMTLETEDQYAADLKKAGVEIVEDVDVEAFAKASRGAYDRVPNLSPGIHERVLKAMAN